MNDPMIRIFERFLRSKLIQRLTCRRPASAQPRRMSSSLALLFCSVVVCLAVPTVASAGTVSGTVFLDSNVDGVKQSIDSTPGGLPVILKTAGGNGIVGDSDDVIIASTTVSGFGNFSFTGIAAGTYYVHFDITPFLNGFMFTPKDQGGNDALDSDADPTTGFTDSFSLGASATVNRDVGLVPILLRSGSGTNAAAIQSAVDSFRADLGVLNPNQIGSANGGRREINWDGVPAQFSAPNSLPADFFHVNSPRGVIFSTSGTGFQVSGATGDSGVGQPGVGQPAAARFGNIQTSYTANFQTFSAQRLFTPLGSTLSQVAFLIPGTTTQGFSMGFGAVFTDVETAGSTTIEFFNQNGASLGKRSVPTSANGGLSFLGISFAGIQARVLTRVRITSGAAALGATEGSSDLVAMDDFIYGEPTPNSNLVLTASDVPDPVTAGTNLTYTLTLANEGTADAHNISLTDPVPNGTTFVSMTQTGGSPFSLNTPAVGGTGTVTATGALAAGATATFTFVVRVNPSVAIGVISNSPRVTSNPPDLISSDNEPNETTAVATAADLSVNTTGPATAAAGSNIAYNISIANAGPSNAQAVAVTDSLFSGTSFVSMTQTSGPAFTLTTPPVGSFGTVNASISTLPSGASATFTLVIQVDPVTPVDTIITNTAAISSSTTDSVNANNTFSMTTTIVPPALSINDVLVTEGNSGSTNATFTVSLSGASLSPATVDYLSSNGTASTPGDYQTVSGTLTFAPGQTTRTVIVPVNGDSAAEGNETFFITLSNPTNATIADAQGQGTIVDNDDAQPTFSFSQSSYGGQEDCDGIVVTVIRSGDTTGTVSVNYATADLSASSHGDYTTAVGKLTFGPGVTSQTFTVLISEDSFSEGTETAGLSLSNPSTGSALGSPSTASIVIVDDLPETAGNPIDQSETFVAQHYHDFLNRVPDASGLAFWTNNIESCGADGGCRDGKRVDTSAAFFLSIEFQETGGIVERIFEAAYNRRVLLSEFLPDTQQLGRDVVVGQTGFEVQLEANKVAYFDEFVGRPAFVTVFGGLNNQQFVDALNGNTGGALSTSERNALVTSLNGATITRAQALRAVVEDADFVQSEFNGGFVLMQYFGYLRRDPDEAGFNFWLNKLNQFNGNFVKAEMVRAFITSAEYRNRFGQ